MPLKLIGENNVMVDLETMGIDLDSAIVAIGAVRFNAQQGIVDRFYQVVSLQSSVDAGLVINPSTVMWWLQQGEEARAQLLKPAQPLDVALLEFREWLKAGKGGIKLWGNGASFDNVILASAYKKTGSHPPWAFYNDHCYRTIKNLYPTIKLERTGVFHCAVDDAESQALHLLEIIKQS